jgi:hypothetical protein
VIYAVELTDAVVPAGPTEASTIPNIPIIPYVQAAERKGAMKSAMCSFMLRASNGTAFASSSKCRRFVSRLPSVC